MIPERIHAWHADIPPEPTPGYASGVTVMLLTLAGVLFVAGVALILTSGVLHRPRRPTLYERLAPFHQPYVADEAELWLKDH